jgi:excisionase family DNA binding protein
MDMAKKYENLKSISQYLGLPPRYIRLLAETGEIPFLNVGGRLRFNADAVRKALDILAAMRVLIAMLRHPSRPLLAGPILIQSEQAAALCEDSRSNWFKLQNIRHIPPSMKIGKTHLWRWSDLR